MANAVNSNTVYVDSAGAVTIGTNRNVKVAYVTFTSTAANAAIVLQDDATSPVNKLEVRIDTTDKTERLNYSNDPIVFPNGIRIGSISNGVATLTLRRNA